MPVACRPYRRIPIRFPCAAWEDNQSQLNDLQFRQLKLNYKMNTGRLSFNQLQSIIILGGCCIFAANSNLSLGVLMSINNKQAECHRREIAEQRAEEQKVEDREQHADDLVGYRKTARVSPLFHIPPPNSISLPNPRMKTAMM